MTPADPNAHASNPTGNQPTHRLRIDCAYRGTHFHGWAKQPGLRTVQGAIEDALELIFRQPIELTVAGRTDAGVHASAQTAHCDIPTEKLLNHTKQSSVEDACTALLRRLNKLVGRPRETKNSGGEADLLIHAIAPVANTFDARFAALRRHYVYRLAATQQRNPLYAETVWWVDADLNISAMQAAGQLLLGQHDFLSYCKPRAGATTIRTLEQLELHETDTHLEIHLTADAFCHSMVRSIVGALVEVGKGRRDAQWIKHLRDDPCRNHAAPLAPPHGLTLRAVDYPPAQDWAAQQQLTRRTRSLIPEGA